MTNPMVRMHDMATNKIVDREMTDAEFADFQADQLLSDQRKAENEANAAAKSALLDRLGLTADEAKLLLS